MKRMILVCAAAALALTACQKKTTDAATAGAATTAAATPPASAPATPPSRKAGLWEQTMTSDKVNQTISMCLDAATETQAKWFSGQRGKSDCAQSQVTPKLGGGWTFHSVCKGPDGTTTTSDGEATGDFGSKYHVELTAVTTGSPMPEANGTHKMSMDGAWKGPCPAGMKGGDMELPGGMRVNMLNPAGPPGSVTTTSIIKRYSADHPPTEADIAKMRAQAEAMAKSLKGQTQ